ncbi:MAG: serine/threonine protein kinase [Kiritimatiellae bacterium]|nr:serine/threonine protein kinase [Kiritimatiellia bacterium]
MSDRLQFVEKIGVGGMSSVWKAYDNANGRYVAVKILDKDLSGDDANVKAFLSEEKIMSEIRHPGIVQAYYIGKSGDTWYLVMEYVDGYTFADLLRRKQHVDEQDCLLICESVASALDYAWNDHGIVHCDIKPENIMINTQGEVKLTDLGISCRFGNREAGDVNVPDHVLGTPAYISPEQVYGDVELDCRADIYSLAATIFHLATGRVLFPGLDNEETMRAHCAPEKQARDPRTYRPELSEGFCQLLEAMLVKDREYRVSSWSNVFQMCQDVESGAKFKPRAADAASSIKLLS